MKAFEYYVTLVVIELNIHRGFNNLNRTYAQTKTDMLAINR